jgi:hypothetical protein
MTLEEEADSLRADLAPITRLWGPALAKLDRLREIERELAGTLAWHFVGAKLRDGRPIPADGEVLRHDGPVELCVSGLHASKRLIDALSYAPGDTLCRVALSGDLQHETDKSVGRERVILWRIDATLVLREFARRCALDVAHLWDMPAIVRQYLETGNESWRQSAYLAATVPERRWVNAWAARAAAWTAEPQFSRRSQSEAAGMTRATARLKQNELLETLVFNAYRDNLLGPEKNQ